MSSLTHPKYRPDIDGLRAIAILSVVGFHAFPALFPSGFIGVDIFFVISGYLISTIIFSNLEHRSFSFIQFYQRRIRRIFPALLVVLAACLAAGWVICVPKGYEQLGKHAAAASAFVLNFALKGEAGYFDNAAISKPLLHLWSLSIEEQFYVVWPLVVWGAWKFRLHWLWLCATAVLISFFLNLHLTARDHTSAFYHPLARFWELSAGSLLAYLALHPLPWFGRFGNLQSALGLGLMAAGIFLSIPQAEFPGWWALFPALGAYLTIAAGPQAWINHHVLALKPLVRIGLISYPLYLWHWPLLSFATIQEGVLSTTARGGLVAASFVLAWLTYVLIEKPLRFGAHARRKTIALIAAMIALGAVGYTIEKSKGVPERFPRFIQQLLEFRFDHTTAWRVGTCFLEPESKIQRTFVNCIDQPHLRPTILVWGDSMAASLYLGVQHRWSNTHRTIQFTAKGCPPMLDYHQEDVHPYCREISDYVLKFIQKEKPERVMMVGLWDQYDWKQSAETILRLKNVGVRRIELVGNFPEWKGDLPQLLYNYYRVHPKEPMPYRLDYRYAKDKNLLEKQLSQFAAELGVPYISGFRIFCDAQGCLARTGETPEDLEAWNNHHLTTRSAEYAAERFPP